MTKIVSTRASPELFHRWRQQIARDLRRRATQGPRPLAAISYLVRGPIVEGLVDLRRLVFVTLHDKHLADGWLTTRVASFASLVIPWGVKIGGPEQSRFEKDLSRSPAFGAKGRRFDLAHPEALTLAFDLDRCLERHLRFPQMPRLRQPRWPALWAAFEPCAATDLCGAGPEFEALGPYHGHGQQVLFRASGRPIGGLVAFPLAYVSHAWQQFGAIYANLKSLPKRQVIALDHPAKNLCGFTGAIEFDLLNSRFAAVTTGVG
jgi:hypothetical protein